MRGLGFLAVTAAVLSTVAGCGSSRQPATKVVATTTVTAARAANPVRHPGHAVKTVRLVGTAYGRALADRRGFALYSFTRDRSPVSTCSGACATAWPPYLVAKRPSAVGAGARAGLLGSVRRRDGRLQVTYAGHPLYYYVGDRRPSQVLCQAATEYGGTWYVVAPDGHPIH